MADPPCLGERARLNGVPVRSSGSPSRIQRRAQLWPPMAPIDMAPAVLKRGGRSCSGILSASLVRHQNTTMPRLQALADLSSRVIEVRTSAPQTRRVVLVRPAGASPDVHGDREQRGGDLGLTKPPIWRCQCRGTLVDRRPAT